MNANRSIQRAKLVLYGCSFVLFPAMLLVGFLMHPNLLGFELTTTAEQLAAKFRNNDLFHIGHLIVTFAVPLIIAMHLAVMQRLRGKGCWYGFIGGLIGIFGAFILAVDKGSLCLVLSGFDTLSDADFAQIGPALQTIVDMDGLLAINWLLVLLSVGGIIQAIGLVKERQLRAWQGIGIVVGLLMQINPGFDIINAAGMALAMLGYWPLGFRSLKAALAPSPEPSGAATLTSMCAPAMAE